jgi:GxxExxY protein
MTTPEIQSDFSHAIIGAAVEVQRVLGIGLLESAYLAAFEVELTEREIAFARNVPYSASYKNWPLGEVYRAGFVIEQSVIVELKAVEVLSDLQRAQVQAALRISGLKLGLLINFNVFPVVKGVHRIASKP